MTNTEVCSTCRFSVNMRMDPQSLERVRVCKRAPPTVTAVLKGGQIAIHSLWPIVSESDYCYSHSSVDQIPVNVPIEGQGGPKSN